VTASTGELQGGAGEFRRHWPVNAAAALGCGAGVTGIPFYSLSSFVEPLTREHGWSRGDVTGALLALTTGMLIGGPIAGRLVAQFGARPVALLSIPLFALGLLLPLFASGPVWTLWLAYFAMAIIGIGTSPIAYTRVLTTCFARHRGLALGIALAGTGVAALVLPPLLALIVPVYGATGGFIALAAIALAAWPFVFFALREGTADATAVERRQGALAFGPLRSGPVVFAILSLAFLSISLGLAGAIVHLTPMMRDAGLDAVAAAGVASAVGFGVIVARLAVGWVVDRVHAPVVAAIVFGVAGLGCLLLGHGGVETAALAALLIGFAVGAEVDLIAYLVSRYFPDAAYPRIYGWQFGMFAIGAGLSPWVLTLLRAEDGSYALALSVAGAIAFVGGALLLALGRYRN
jgi:MFS family permease